jgi:hypothetical protein
MVSEGFPWYLRTLHGTSWLPMVSKGSVIQIVSLADVMKMIVMLQTVSNFCNAMYRLLVGKPEGKGPPGRPRRRWVYNIKMDLLEICWGGVDWIGLAQDRDKWRALVIAVMNLRVP